MSITKRFLEHDSPRPRPETQESENRRFDRERALLEHAREEMKAGRYVPDEELDAWLDRFVEGNEVLPIPGEASPEEDPPAPGLP